MILKRLLPLIALASFTLPAIADSTSDKAIADIVAAQTKLHALKSLDANVTTVTTVSGHTTTSTGIVKCLKPNFLWIQAHVTGHPTLYHISDGKHYCANNPKGHWTSVKSDPHGANFRNDLLLWSDFYVLYATQNAANVVDGADVTVAAKAVDGHPYEVITAAQTPNHPLTMAVYIDKSDGLIHRMTVEGGPMHLVETWSNIKHNPPLSSKDFQPKY